jgi:hypothetical protein
VSRRALAVAVAFMLVVPVAASARKAPAHLQDDRVPSAQVQAAGTGSITIIGRMVVNGTIPDRGTVTIIDRKRDATAYLAGQQLQFNRRGKVTVRRASGILFVTGSNVQVQVQGAGLTFAAAGYGRARFLGSGTYRLNSGEEKAWSRRWVTVAPDRSSSRRGRR